MKTARSGGFGRYLHPFGVPPKPLEILIAACAVQEHVDDQITVVLQNPFRIVIAFKAYRDVTPIFQLMVNLITDSLILAGVGAGADEEIIGKAGDLSQIEDH